MTWTLQGSADIAFSPEALELGVPTLHSPVAGCAGFAADAATADIDAFVATLREQYPGTTAGNEWDYFENARILCWRFGPGGEDENGCLKGNLGDEHEGWEQSRRLGAALAASPLVTSVDADGTTYKAPFSFDGEEPLSPATGTVCLDDLRTVSATARSTGSIFVVEPALAPPFGPGCTFSEATCPSTFEPTPACDGPSVDIDALRAESIARLQALFDVDGLDDGTLTFIDGFADAGECYVFDFAHVRYSVPVPPELVPPYLPEL